MFEVTFGIIVVYRDFLGFFYAYLAVWVDILWWTLTRVKVDAGLKFCFLHATGSHVKLTVGA